MLSPSVNLLPRNLLKLKFPRPKRSREKEILQDSRLTVEQGVPALPTLPFITSSCDIVHLERAKIVLTPETGPPSEP
ncbi:hypothetical protein Tco_0719419 [Tanacetum coccineum]